MKRCGKACVVCCKGDLRDAKRAKTVLSQGGAFVERRSMNGCCAGLVQ